MTTATQLPVASSHNATRAVPHADPKEILSFRVLPKVVVLTCTVSSLAFAGCSQHSVQPFRAGLVRSCFET